jgi:CubicO group peptidase (beta-lactamase class C family)
MSALPGDPTAVRQELVRLVAGMEPAAMPGAVMDYSDLGYAVAGAMLESAAGLSWERLVERVAGMLGLTTLGFDAPGAPGEENQPWGHLPAGGGLAAVPPGPRADQAAPGLGPAGTVHLSIGDWARYAAYHLTAARGDAGVPALSALYEDPYAQGYGLGWVLTEAPFFPGRVLAHTGSCGAWAAVIWIVPQADAALVATSNFGGVEGFQACETALRTLAETRLAEPVASAP